MSHEEEFGSHSGSDSYTEVTEQGFFSRLFSSIFSALFGVAIFFGSFVVLYMNEGSVDESKIVKNAVEVNAAAPSAGAHGKFVAATGPLKTSEKIGDEYLEPGNYVMLARTAEMYAWEETSHEKKEKKVGGGERTITTYDYSRKWTSSPESSSSFKVKSGHHNPEMNVRSETWKAKDVQIGQLDLDMRAITLPSGKAIRPTESQLRRGGDVSGGYIYTGNASPGSPRVGDVRVSYSAIAPGGEFTAVGSLMKGALAPATVEKRTFYRVFDGTKKDAIGTLHGEYLMWVWGFRLLGFLMMWGGMRMFMEPLNTLLDILPIFGSIGRGVTGFLTFPIAAILSTVTIVVAQIMHNLIAMIVVGLLVVAGCVMAFGKKGATGAARKARA